MLSLLASTTRMLQPGQAADTASTSSDVSSPQLALARGSAVVPLCPTIRRQPFAVVQGSSPNSAR